MVDIAKLKHREMKPLHKEIRMVFQDPFSSLNPRITVKDVIAEPIVIHKMLPKSEIQDRVAGLMQDVGLNPDYMNRYPHEFSGGQRQRIGIARALAPNQNLSSAMNRFPPWMFPYRPKSSVCWKSFNGNWE